jgi:glycosyltransferase involved in cell wall biosynthesis
MFFGGKFVKILLLGEFSGFHTNLKSGLKELGHEVHICSSGDRWKKFEGSDIKLFSYSDNPVIRRICSLMYQLKMIPKLKNYDVVQLVCPHVFSEVGYWYNQMIIKLLKKNNEKLILSVAGDHYFIYETFKKLRYTIFENFDEKNSKYCNKSYIENNKKVVEMSDGIIPITYTYAESYRWNKKLLRTIPLPVDYTKVQFSPQVFKDGKVKIFHGINNENSKGTKYIREAMEKLKANYPEKVEILIDGKMPIKKYLKVLKDSNIVIDQALSYSYGMNAIYSMAMGKVVLSGNEPECQKEYSRFDIPVINITPSVDTIYRELEKLILNEQEIISIGSKSRKFIEDFHNHIDIAKLYINEWKSIRSEDKNE